MTNIPGCRDPDLVLSLQKAEMQRFHSSASVIPRNKPAQLEILDEIAVVVPAEVAVVVGVEESKVSCFAVGASGRLELLVDTKLLADSSICTYLTQRAAFPFFLRVASSPLPSLRPY